MDYQKMFEVLTGSGKRNNPNEDKQHFLEPPEKQLTKPQINKMNAMQLLEQLQESAPQISDPAPTEISEEAKEEKFSIESKNIENCTHETIFLLHHQRKERDPTRPPAKKYSFTLDAFQRESIDCIERNESVLVAAHTSAGKTVVAEYAIALALKKKQRVIYTSPIKALSNQKYREFTQEFSDVGLMTGDVTMNPHASCLVMTTEILRNMLYKGSEVVREMAWVIFDEIHYMRDKERGVVWEETIILVPTAVKCVFLSATIQNAREFAMWICKIKDQPCNVVYTDFRPVPLQHFLYPKGAEGITLVVDSLGKFHEERFNTAIAILDEQNDLSSVLGRRRQEKRTAASEMKKLVEMLIENKFDPCIVFSFSKDECEKHLLSLANLDLTKAEEKAGIEKVYMAAISTLSEEDQNLKMITGLLPLLKKGIGVHHGGLLPILKEVIEILFQEGLIKVIFTTETFSLGINMPARTVIFTSIEKFDGETFRWIGGGEYIQMSGRAGRRGLDDKGNCILIADKRMDTDVAKSIMKGSPDPLNSSFRINFNMLLNMQRIEDMDPTYIISRSFFQFQRDQALPQKKKELEALHAEYKSKKFPEAKTIRNFKKLQEESILLNKRIHEKVILPQHVIPYLCPGRLVHIADSEIDWGWGIVIQFQKRLIQTHKNIKDFVNKIIDQKLTERSEEVFVVDVMLYVQRKVSSENTLLPGSVVAGNGQLEIVAVLMNMISELSKVKMKLLPNLRVKDSMHQVGLLYRELMTRFNYALPLMDLLEDLEIHDTQLDEMLEKRGHLHEEIKFAAENCSEYQMLQYEELHAIKTRIHHLKAEIQKGSKIALHDDLTLRQRVLRRLDFCDKNTVLTKGKVACEISAGDELLSTELLFSGKFNNLRYPVIAAVLSCIIFNEGKAKEKVTKNEELKSAFFEMRDIAGKIANVISEIDVKFNAEEYVNQFKPDMMDIVYAWCTGVKFGELCKLTEIYEGTIIRCFRRLDELVKELIEAAKIIGNEVLESKFQEISTNLRRDIVFAASLYL